MPVQQERVEKTAARLHVMILEARKKASVTGVLDVGSFNDQVVEVKTEEGGMVIRGKGLHIEKINLDNGEMMLAGSIDNIAYVSKSPGSKRTGNIISRIFR